MIRPDLLAHLRSAHVLLVGRRGGISDLIKQVTHSCYSHAALIAQSAGAWIVLEATTDVRGVAARKLEVITDDPTVERLLLRVYPGLSPDQGEQIVQAMWLLTGQPYSQRVNLEILLGLPVHAVDGVNCAAAVADAYAAVLGPVIDRRIPTPEAFAASRFLVDLWEWRRSAPPVEPTISAPPQGP